VSEHESVPETAPEPVGLTVRELLEQVFTLLRGDSELIDLPNVVDAVIADDSDWHRTRKGYVLYKQFTVADFGGQPWLLALGSVGGDYPCRPFCCDIFVYPCLKDLPAGTPLPEDGDLVALAQKMLSDNDYYRLSVIMGMANGLLNAVKGSDLVHTVVKQLRECVNDYVAQEMVVNHEVLSLSTLQPAVNSPVLYKAEFASAMADIIRTALENERL